jgi:hypothetical protein
MASGLDAGRRELLEHIGRSGSAHMAQLPERSTARFIDEGLVEEGPRYFVRLTAAGRRLAGLPDLRDVPARATGRR